MLFLPFCTVWSFVGPVFPVPVGPLALVQSNISLLSWVHRHRSFSKLQSNGVGIPGVVTTVVPVVPGVVGI